MIAGLLMFAAAVVGGPAEPMPETATSRLQPAEVQLGMLPTLVHGTEANQVADRLRDKVSSVLESGDFTLRKVDIAGSGEPGPYCQDAVCWQGLSNEHAVSHLLQLEVRFEEPDWQLEAIVVDGATGSVVGRVTRTCDLCGYDELASAVADATSAVRRELEASIVPAPILAVETTPAGAVVAIDGGAVGKTPLELSLEPGEHDIRVTHGGFITERRRVAVVDGVRHALTIGLRPAPTEGGDKQRRGGRGLMIAGATSVAAGLALIGVGTALVVVHERPIENDCSGNNVDPDGNCRYLRDTLAGGITSLAVGAGGLVAGVVLLVLDRRKRTSRAAAVRPSWGGVRMHF